ncbi:MAG: nuclear transport factor 2 family protein [Parasphingorhabdus sp.]
MSEREIAALQEQIAELTKRVTVCEDEQSVRKLHHLYGYMIDKCLYNEVVDLFTDNCEVHFFGGIYRGKAGAARLYVERFQTNFTHGNNGPIDGFLLDHPQHQDVIDILDDGVTALGRFRCTMQAGRHKDFAGEGPMEQARQWWEGGLYENTYKKIDGVWRIHILNYVPQWHADYETGWANTREQYVPFLDTAYPEDPTGPDEIKPREDLWLWPTHKVVPFHNVHPVTGKPIQPERWQGDIDREKAAK